jgi:RNA 2',3'-cyclic 3'-phosphodiesterase
MPTYIRTFIAVEIDDAVRRKAVETIEKLRGCRADVKWVEPQNLHVTLQFLGDMAEERIPLIVDAVQKGTAEVKKFELEIEGVGAFPNIVRPRTIWIGAKNGATSMRFLHDRVAESLFALEIDDEDREFKSHLTIGRVRSNKNIAAIAEELKKHAASRFGRVLVDRAVVYSSRLSPAGPVYNRLGEAMLAEQG